MDEIKFSPLVKEQELDRSSTILQSPTNKGNFPAIFGGLFLLMVFLAPLAVFPILPILSFVAKLGVVSTLATISIIILLMNILNVGEIQFPKNKIILTLSFIPITALISALFSGNIVNSIVGNAFEVGTAGSFLLLFILFILAVIAGSKEAMIKRAIWAFLFSMGFAILYTFFVSLMQYGFIPAINGLPFTLPGNYIDFGILLSAAVMLALCLLNFLGLPLKSKIALWIFIILSLLIVGAIGFRPALITLGIFSLALFVYSASVFRNRESNWINKSYSTLAVLVGTFALIISSGASAGFLAKTLKINSFDVRPNVETTLDVVKSEWLVNPITGSGPNRFAELWALYKPLEVNQSNFWNTDFSYGSGLVPTLAATLGILGLASIAVFLFIFIKNGFNAFFAPVKDSARFISVSMFLASFLLWTGTFVYTPGLEVLSLIFIFTGLFTASLYHAGISQNVRINIFKNPKTNFISVFLAVVLMIGTVSLEYFVLRKAAASAVFQRAVFAYNADGDVLKAEKSISKAIGISSSDLYRRSKAELYLLNIERIASSIPASGEITESEKAELQTNVANAVEFAKEAISLNPTNYQNHLIMGRIYESLAFKGIQGAAESAKNSYAAAEKLSPKNPSVQLGFARIAAFGGDAEEAKNYVNKAIELKWNYTDAYFTLAQLEAARNDISGVIKAVESATIADPANAGLYFQLGLIKYNNDDFIGAASAFEQAVAIVSDYANARYFLGLSYEKLNKNSLAILQFEEIQETNPDNAEVKLILSNLRAGRPPFADAKPPIDSKPEKRKNPPIKENSSEMQSGEQ